MGMSQTLRVTQPNDPAKLHTALEAAGFKVLTIRSDWAKSGDPVCMGSVIVFDPSIDLVSKAAQIQNVINAHLATLTGKVPSATPVGYDQNAALTFMEKL
jgi:hypothetical protein